MDQLEQTNLKDWQKGFDEGALAERSRLISYLVKNSIIRRDAFGVWVRETMGDEVTDLPELELEKSPERKDDQILIDPAEIGAMMARINKQHDLRVRDRLVELRELAPANSEVSIAISKWVREIV